MNLKQFLRAYTTERSTLSGGGESYRGFVMGHGIDHRIPHGFKERRDWADGLARRVWVSGEERATITVCEGDVMVTCHRTDKEYQNEITRQERFYRADTGRPAASGVGARIGHDALVL